MMLALVLKLLRPLVPYLAAGAALAGLLLYISVLRGQLGVAQAENASLRTTNEADAAALVAERKQQELADDALDALNSATRTTQAETERVMTQIVGAGAQDNGPVAPVLAKALDGLRALQTRVP